MAYYDDEPNAGLDWYDAEVKRHTATKADLARVTTERDAARVALDEIAELVGPGGDDTPFGRVESALMYLTTERDAAVAALAHVHALPELEWAEVTASLMMRLSALARGGNAEEARSLLAVLDRGKTYVTRVVVERDEARKEADFWCDEAEGMEAIALTAIDGPPECLKGRRIVQDVVDALKAARAEVEAMRAVADKLATLTRHMHVGHGFHMRSSCGVCIPVDDAIDALRAKGWWVMWHRHPDSSDDAMVPTSWPVTIDRDDLIRLVVGMQWREMIQSVCVINDNGFGTIDGGVDERVEVTPGFDDVHGPATDIVDEWLGVK
jgi:hypothetical protein